jgi:hypothetical protein
LKLSETRCNFSSAETSSKGSTNPVVEHKGNVRRELFIFSTGAAIAMAYHVEQFDALVRRVFDRRRFGKNAVAASRNPFATPW